jgi:DNA polymerase III subunit epsilon
MFADTVIVLDFETNGMRPEEGHRVTEVAAVLIRNNRVVDHFDSLLNCGARIPEHISRFTGISQAMVDGAPDATSVFSELLEFIGEHPVVAHNAWFDRAFLESECSQLGLAYPNRDFICSVKIARKLFPEMPSHALGCLASRLEIPFMPGAHRATVDAAMTSQVLLRCCEVISARLGLPSVDVSVLRHLAGVEESIAIAVAA